MKTTNPQYVQAFLLLITFVLVMIVVIAIVINGITAIYEMELAAGKAVMPALILGRGF